MLLCVSPIVHVPHSMSPSPLVGFRTCDWWRRAGFVVIAPVPIHQWTWALYSASHLRRGQFLHLQTLARGKKKKKNQRIRVSFCIFATFSSSSTVQLLSRLFAVISVFGLIFFLFPWKKEVPAFDLIFFFRGGEEALRSLFIHLIGWGSFVAPKSMGAQISKTAGKEEAAVEKPAEGAAVAAKTNGQVNHIL